jgi:hypothetical protein
MGGQWYVHVHVTFPCDAYGIHWACRFYRYSVTFVYRERNVKGHHLFNYLYSF